MSMPSILEQILAKKREEIAALQALPPHERVIAALQAGTLDRGAKRSLVAALHRSRAEPVRVLAEIKRASPSAGTIRADADPVAIAREYAEAGAAAISVLTDREFFAGDVAFLAPCKRAVALPILRKDFLIDPDQVYEGTILGADAVLLIVAALPGRELATMLRAVRDNRIEALVEVHSLAEAEIALAAGAKLVGVNHRDLHTFAIDMTLTEQIAKRVPGDVVLVAESGIKTKGDVRRLGDAGAHAVLVGETLMRAPSPGDALRELLA
ncbi:MAG TPA: indole-3-glycerol phosphate synthase TrpC [Kofleriaceae bacterium]|nr:indole-3-glycerol phosphate synthase TrpC [Kofleriaceae bacterium]